MDAICLGDAIIDFFPVKSGINLNEVAEFIKIPSGAVVNVAVGVSRLGLKSAFIGRVGNEAFGHSIKKMLEDNLVDTSQLQFDDNINTGLNFVAIPKPGAFEFLFYKNPSADAMLDSEKLDENFYINIKVFQFGSLTLNKELSKSATYKAISLAKSNGSIIVNDPNLRLPLWSSQDHARFEIKKSIPFTDVLKVNNEELVFITQKKDMEIATKEILSMGVKLCIVTTGPNGCVYATRKYYGHVPTFNKIKIVDTLGCGDCFVAALIVGLVENDFLKILEEEDKIKSILRFANGAASITSLKKGVIPA
ncbi:MAG: PfkB family carbohydrate kinase, partial [Actinobacteria bacterium]|nr:PfkB family carbohydrate kinase [Actinomycetota bacterium]